MDGAPKPVRLHIGAKSDLQESVNFYRNRGGDKLADRFKSRIDEAFKTVAATPERFRRDSQTPDLHWYRVEQFPFSLLYIVRQNYIWVVAVAHGSRRPGYWQERLK